MTSENKKTTSKTKITQIQKLTQAQFFFPQTLKVKKHLI